MNHKTLTLLVTLMFTMQLFADNTPVDKLNVKFNQRKSPTQLKKDVDYIHKKITKLHPDLYHYISKNELDYKFDSLKSTITDSLTSSDFYFRISPVISSIKQGHTMIFPATKKLSPKMQSSVNKHGTTPLVKFGYKWQNDKLIIVKSYGKDSSVQIGSELVSVNGISPKSIISKYNGTFASDGQNTTFINARHSQLFPNYLYLETGVLDSVICVLRDKDSTSTVKWMRLPKASITAKKETKSAEQIKIDRKKQQVESEKRYVQGYDVVRNTYSKELSFPTADSSIAVLRISDFVKGDYKKFYKQSFQKIARLKSNTLILDMRNNGGGRISEINNLYSYLADTTFTLMKKAEVTTKTSLWHNGYFSSKNPLVLGIRVIFSPIMMGVDGYFYFNTHKSDDGKYYYSIKESKPTKPAENNFKGKIYVLINGGCFSATSIISTHLKAKERATFIGEETGGAYNGCVAGFMPARSLPNTELTVLFGLMVCEAPYKTAPDGRGILPDIELKPTQEQLFENPDPQMKYVMELVKSHR